MENNKIFVYLARITSWVFHPFLIPSLGFLLLLNSGFYFAILPWTVKQYILLVVFLSTCVLPAISIGLLALNPKFDVNMEKSTDRILPLILTSLYYYLGYLILRRLPVFPIYNFFLISSVLVQIALLIVSMRWKISAHLAAIGGLVGGFLGLSIRLHENPVAMLIGLILIGGLVGTARLMLQKHTSQQVYAGFLLGVTVMGMVFLFI